jgi:hypothetical protein
MLWSQFSEFFALTSSIVSKNRQFFAEFFGEYNNIGPRPWFIILFFL